MSFFGFGQSVEVEILLNDAESRKRAEHKTEDGKKEKYFLFYDGETVSGKVSLALKNPNKRLEHQGIKIEFIGQIARTAGRGADWGANAEQADSGPNSEACHSHLGDRSANTGFPIYQPSATARRKVRLIHRAPLPLAPTNIFFSLDVV
ncbi:hypothetical protein P7K49_021167 [Saguinus oedipus]|uniref:Vacuolar protein sorting-associated protein 26B n=1 Tax=Saguinus oedipus TaxID=9490 RepID=A0ABQ9USL2_SAGOE|nr:hypothetical protein P7K49_021167 [Saguinus oedipus]